MAKKKVAKKKLANSSPKLWTEAQCFRLFPKAIDGTGGVMETIARRLGTSAQTMYSYQKKFPWFADMRAEARSQFVDVAESKLVKKVNEEEDWAIRFTLTTLGRDRGYANKQEVDINANITDARIEFEPPIDITPEKDGLEDKTD